MTCNEMYSRSINSKDLPIRSGFDYQEMEPPEGGGVGSQPPDDNNGTEPPV